MRELTFDEVRQVSGGVAGNEITDDEAMALAQYYGAVGGAAALFPGGQGFAGVCFVLSAGFALYAII